MGTNDRKCDHQYAVVDTAPWTGWNSGKNRKFAKWFELGSAARIKFLTVRRMKCSLCEKKRISIEVYASTMETIIERLEDADLLQSRLTELEKANRRLKAENRRLKAKLGLED